MTVSLVDFLQAIGQLPQISADEVTKAIQSLPVEKRADIAGVAQELVKRKLVTRGK